jgi:UDP-N-acetylglucosamine:LPS N-acetylglucosamine transferase
MGCDVLIVNLMEVLQSFDPLNKYSGGNCQGEDFYNFLQKNNYKGLLNKFSSIGADRMIEQTDAIAQVLEDYLKVVKADIVICTLAPFSPALIKSTEKLDIPLIVVATDLDASLFAKGISSPTHKKFKFFLAFEDPEMRKKIAGADIPQENIVISGFPVGPEFLEYKDLKVIKDEFNISQIKPVVMLMFGAQGSKACLKYAEELAQSKIPLHIIICIGKSEHLRLLLERIKFNEGVTRNIVGFTDRVADFMKAADMLFFRPGTVSLSEGLYSGKPVFLDATPSEDSYFNNNNEVMWEAFNPEFVKKNNVGDVVTSVDQINPMVEKYVNNDQGYQSLIKQGLKNLNKLLFSAVFIKVVHSLMSGKPPVLVMNK